MRTRDILNLIVDLLLFLGLVFMAGIGFLIKFALPPGRERILNTGRNAELYFLGWDRHEWGGLHLLVAYAVLFLLLLHIVLHWKTILCLVRKALPHAGVRRSLWALLGGICLFLLLAAFLITPVSDEASGFLHRNVRSDSVSREAGEVDRDRGEESGKPPAAETAVAGGRGELHEEEDHTGLNGRMTLREVALHYGLSVVEVKRRLGLPPEADETETMGRLRRRYGFSMTEARERLKADR